LRCTDGVQGSQRFAQSSQKKIAQGCIDYQGFSVEKLLIPEESGHSVSAQVPGENLSATPSDTL